MWLFVLPVPLLFTVREINSITFSRLFMVHAGRMKSAKEVRVPDCEDGRA